MKKVICLLLLLFICVLGFSQTIYEEVIYLKNGSIIRGVIIEQIPGKSYKIKTKDRNVFVFKAEEVEKITKEEVPIEKTNSTEKVKKSPFDFSLVPNKGYMGTLNLGVLMSSYNGDEVGVSLSSTHGLKLSKTTFLGLGTGIEIWGDAYLPVFLDFRFSPKKGQVSPDLGLTAGIESDFNDIYPRGSIFTGVKCYLEDKKSAINIHLGYKFGDNQHTLSWIFLKLGYSF